MAIEIVDLPTKNVDFLQLCKRLPEGTYGFGRSGQENYTDYILGLFQTMGFAQQIAFFIEKSGVEFHWSGLAWFGYQQSCSQHTRYKGWINWVKR